MPSPSDDAWESLRNDVHGQCGGCPRNQSKVPVLFPRRDKLINVEFLVLSQEPGFWLRQLQTSVAIESRLVALCRSKEGGPDSADVRRANPLSKVIQIFGGFDPCVDRVYWSHALKCVPTTSDRDINKEWRKAATKCEEFFLEEVRLLGKENLNVITFGKFALELCLHAFDDQDINQELGVSEFMQTHKFPLSFKHKFKDGTVKNVSLFVYGNPSSEVVNIQKSGGKMTVEQIQEMETARLTELFNKKR